MEARATTEPDPRPACGALAEEDRVHRDVCLSEVVFAPERQHRFASTWSYLGHASQGPEAGDYLTQEIAGLPPGEAAAAEPDTHRLPFIHVEARGDEEVMLAGTCGQLLARIGGARKFRQKRVELFNPERPLPAIQLFV
jgi:hypothetical protein